MILLSKSITITVCIPKVSCLPFASVAQCFIFSHECRLPAETTRTNRCRCELIIGLSASWPDRRSRSSACACALTKGVTWRPSVGRRSTARRRHRRPIAPESSSGRGLVAPLPVWHDGLFRASGLAWSVAYAGPRWRWADSRTLLSEVGTADIGCVWHAIRLDRSRPIQHVQTCKPDFFAVQCSSTQNVQFQMDFLQS